MTKQTEGTKFVLSILEEMEKRRVEQVIVKTNTLRVLVDRVKWLENLLFQCLEDDCEGRYSLGDDLLERIEKALDIGREEQGDET